MTEYRCKFCHRLLFKSSEIKRGAVIVETVCPKCKKLNIFEIEQ